MVKSVITSTEASQYCRECLAQNPPVENPKIANKKRMLCKSHYKRFYTKNQCTEDGCKRLAKDTQGRCGTHTEEHEERSCTTEACSNVLQLRANFCNTCYMRMWRSSKRRGNKLCTEQSLKDRNQRERASSEVTPTHSCLQEQRSNLLNSKSMAPLGQIVSPRNDIAVKSSGNNKDGMWFYSRKEHLFLCASEVGCMFTGTASDEKTSAAVHFLQKMLSSKGTERVRKKRHSFVQFDLRQKRRKRNGFTLNKLSQLPYGTCT
ncbi:MAG: hypothetical protein ACTSUE_25215 [Promethearchaeota archaeon]